ncbi:MAG: ATP-binding cassette domain-containing protein [Chloroflexota bacterium]
MSETAATDALIVSKVSKAYVAGETEVQAVADASLTVARGEVVLVQGPSGSGKTTLLAMCGALLRPDAGRIWVDGIEVTATPERRLPEVRLRRVGFVFQSANLLANLTALENVQVVVEAAGATRRDAGSRARDLLAELRLGDRLDSLPRQLSGGEAQRVAIARALANDPPIVLADEPTANLDSRTGYQLMHTLELLAKERGKAVLAVTHDHRIEDVADRILWLEDGRLADRPPSATETDRDPVCGMTVTIEHAAGRRTVAGHDYAFCSEICLDRFDADPDRYVNISRA